MPKRRGFTLIELLIAMAITMVLTGLVYPLVANVGDLAGPAVMAATVRQVREKVIYHMFLGDVPLSSEGYPDSIEPAWFNTGVLPADIWTGRPFKVQVVHGGKDATYPPGNVSFVIKPDGTAAGHTAWYNAANGSFCVMVPKVGTKQEQEELFRRINGCGPDGG